MEKGDFSTNIEFVIQPTLNTNITDNSDSTSSPDNDTRNDIPEIPNSAPIPGEGYQEDVVLPGRPSSGMGYVAGMARGAYSDGQ
jgi:hypothetical protein